MDYGQLGHKDYKISICNIGSYGGPAGHSEHSNCGVYLSSYDHAGTHGAHSGHNVEQFSQFF